MEPASKNVVNDMSKPAIVNNTKMPIETNIKERDCKRISDFCTFPNVENKESETGEPVKILKLLEKDADLRTPCERLAVEEWKKKQDPFQM